MRPEAALQKQIEKYRSMTGKQRSKLTFELHQLACEVSRCGIRHQHPDASADEVERLLQERIALAQEL